MNTPNASGAGPSASPSTSSNPLLNEFVRLHQKAREAVARMATTEKKDALDAILRNVQDGIVRAEAMLGVKLHVVAQDTNDHVIPLYSQTILFAFSQVFGRSHYAIGSLSDVIDLANTARKEAEDRLRSPTAPLTSLPASSNSHIPNTNPILPAKMVGKQDKYPGFTKTEPWFTAPTQSIDKGLLSAFVTFKGSDGDLRAAFDRVSHLNRCTAAQYKEEVSKGPLEVSFAVPKVDYRRVLYVDSIVYQALAMMEVEKLQNIWYQFFHALRKPSGTFSYSSFLPPWYGELSDFVSGGTELFILCSGDVGMPPLKKLLYRDGRRKACCILVAWLSLERNTRSLLAKILGEYGVKVELQPIPEFRESSFLLPSVAMTLYNGIPSDGAIDAFLGILNTVSTKVLPMEFAYHLVHRTESEWYAWCQKSEMFDANISRIICPLRDSRNGYHALAIIDYVREEIVLVDSQHAKRTFIPLLPNIYCVAKSLGSSRPQKFALNEDADAASTLASVTYSPILMCYHAFVMSTENGAPLTPSVSQPALRKLILSCATSRSLTPILSHSHVRQSEAESTPLQSSVFHSPSPPIHPISQPESPPPMLSPPPILAPPNPSPAEPAASSAPPASPPATTRAPAAVSTLAQLTPHESSMTQSPSSSAPQKSQAAVLDQPPMLPPAITKNRLGKSLSTAKPTTAPKLNSAKSQLAPSNSSRDKTVKKAQKSKEKEKLAAAEAEVCTVSFYSGQKASSDTKVNQQKDLSNEKRDTLSKPKTNANAKGNSTSISKILSSAESTKDNQKLRPTLAAMKAQRRCALRGAAATSSAQGSVTPGTSNRTSQRPAPLSTAKPVTGKVKRIETTTAPRQNSKEKPTSAVTKTIAKRSAQKASQTNNQQRNSSTRRETRSNSSKSRSGRVFRHL